MTAPSFRSVDALTGDVADHPSRFFGALSEADNFVREIDTVRELQTRVQELTAERDDLAGQVVDGRETNQLLLESIANLNRQVAKLEAERDAARAERNTWRCAGDAR